MPQSWKETFNHIQPDALGSVLKYNGGNEAKKLWPLSILALEVVLKQLTISRDQKEVREIPDRFQIGRRAEGVLKPSKCLTHPKLYNLLAKKNIKLKKRHEIEQMSQATAIVAKECNVTYVIDFGSGLGHLSRMLTYGYGLRVCCLEKQTVLNEQAA